MPVPRGNWIILVYRPFRIGDDVALLEPGHPGPRGRVFEMNLMFTTAAESVWRDESKALLCVSNSQFSLKGIRCRRKLSSTKELPFLGVAEQDGRKQD